VIGWRSLAAAPNSTGGRDQLNSMPHQKIAHRLQTAVGLSDDDRDLLANVPKKMRSFSDHEAIVRGGRQPSHCALIVEGFAKREKIVGGKNQILAFYIAGDAPDLHTFQLPIMDDDLTSAGRSTVAFISHADLGAMLEKSRALTNALWRETLVNAAIYREWVAALARDATARVTHLICEFAARLEMVGLLEHDQFRVPFTQTDLGDACGLSTVHINRTLQDLKRRGLIKWQGQTVTMLKREELQMIAEFLPDYLHQGRS
jgi:CRP-like cAMP-binding protein